MRRFIAALTLVLSLVLLTPAASLAGGNDALYGLNGVITSPADIGVGVVMGDQFNLVDIPVVDPVTDRFIGLFTGTGIFVLRFGTGLADIFTSPMTGWVRGPYSPDAYFEVLPGLD